MSIVTPPLYLECALSIPVFGSLAVIVFLGCAWFIGNPKFRGNRAKNLALLMLGLWALGPPIWFFYEHFFHFPAHGNPEAGYAALEGAQDVTSKVWAAFAIVLGALYNRKFPGL
ncbi:MAG: hypothetical protein JWQ90_1276 [Hydrocarboniphaga sp.]|uniref:hypothetical protein n=1 Tax=Hydrocarboniphaga sp. TaxID=2033016 RepID=UPI00262F984B|nr:hypothetical protein [Hydrocarboniphaga sp.]MDB5968826.1 hypothetical protein [Hydrocarboniphaga sp.]